MESVFTSLLCGYGGVNIFKVAYRCGHSHFALCITSGKRQSKTPLNRQCGSKAARNSVFDCHLSPIGRQKASENSVSDDF